MCVLRLYNLTSILFEKLAVWMGSNELKVWVVMEREQPIGVKMTFPFCNCSFSQSFLKIVVFSTLASLSVYFCTGNAMLAVAHRLSLSHSVSLQGISSLFSKSSWPE